MLTVYTTAQVYRIIEGVYKWVAHTYETNQTVATSECDTTMRVREITICIDVCCVFARANKSAFQQSNVYVVMSFCWAVGFRAEWILHHMKFTSRRANCLRYQMNKFTLKMLHNFWYGINANEFVHINEQWKKCAMQKWFLSIRAMVCHSTDNTNHRDDDTWSSISLSHDNHSTKKTQK